MPREQSLIFPHVLAHIQSRCSTYPPHPTWPPPFFAHSTLMFQPGLTSLLWCFQSEDVQGSVCQVDMEQVQLQKVLFR